MEKGGELIKLTENEDKLFSTLVRYKKELGIKTVMRVAGGWVRDKVVMIQCRLWARSRTTSILLWTT